jgi:hypothetical protein
MPKPDFLRMNCLGNGGRQCEACPRDFVVTLDAIVTITKTQSGKAILQTGDHYFHHPLCGAKLRSIITELSYGDILNMLDGRLRDIGTVKMEYVYDN